MAAAHPLPAPVARGSEESPELAGERVLVSIEPDREPGRGIVSQSPVVRLPVELDVGVPVRGFRMRNLLALEPGEVIETQWSHGEDLPLMAGAVQLAWTEFEVLDTQLAVRVTRLV